MESTVDIEVHQTAKAIITTDMHERLLELWLGATRKQNL